MRPTFSKNDCFQVFQKISDFIKSESTDFWSELSLSEKQEIEKGIEQLDNGQRVKFNDFMKKIS